MDTAEGNKLIVEFMIDEFSGTTHSKPLSQFPGYEWKGEKDYSKSLHYHDSWDWLMPVVEKATKIGSQTELAYYHIGRTFEEIKTALYIVHIEGVWAAVIKVIEWYNKQ